MGERAALCSSWYLADIVVVMTLLFEVSSVSAEIILRSVKGSQSPIATPITDGTTIGLVIQRAIAPVTCELETRRVH